MKGSLRTLRIQGHHHFRTNYNDWSDPKLEPIKKDKIKFEPKKKLSEPVEGNPSLGSQTSIEIEYIRHKIKKGHPLLTKKEIRKIKLPYHESLLLNLKEDGFEVAYEFIKHLLELEEKWHIKREQNPEMIKNRPLLKSNPYKLHTLTNGLTRAELAKREGDRTKEMESLLGLASAFNEPDEEEWVWIAQELFEQTLGAVEHDKFTIDKELLAIAQHLYASFLLNEMHNLEKAQYFVEESMKLSLGKNWYASTVTGRKGDILYLESCLLLHKIFLEMSHESKGLNNEQAIILCRNALHWAKQVNCKSAEATALMNLILIHIEAEQYNPILTLTENFMKLCQELNDFTGLCEGYVLLATYYEHMNYVNMVIETIQKLLSVAKEHSLIKMMAVAHHKLALFYSMQGDEKAMQHHAKFAYSYYMELNDKPKMEETSCLTGIAQAQELMSQYVNIVLEANNTDTAEFKILTWWKSLHVPFFSNIKLFQPEAKVNSELKERMEVMRNDEMEVKNKARQAEKISAKATSKHTLKSLVRSESTMSRLSLSVLAFQRNMEIAAKKGSSSFSFIPHSKYGSDTSLSHL